jgi:hypothetical protein
MIFQKLKCFIGGHQWKYTGSFSYIEPACLTDEEIKKYGTFLYTNDAFECKRCKKQKTTEEKKRIWKRDFKEEKELENEL